MAFAVSDGREAGLAATIRIESIAGEAGKGCPMQTATFFERLS